MNQTLLSLIIPILSALAGAAIVRISANNTLVKAKAEAAAAKEIATADSEAARKKREGETEAEADKIALRNAELIQSTWADERDQRRKLQDKLESLNNQFIESQTASQAKDASKDQQIQKLEEKIKTLEASLSRDAINIERISAKLRAISSQKSNLQHQFNKMQELYQSAIAETSKLTAALSEKDKTIEKQRAEIESLLAERKPSADRSGSIGEGT